MAERAGVAEEDTEDLGTDVFNAGVLEAGKGLESVDEPFEVEVPFVGLEVVIERGVEEVGASRRIALSAPRERSSSALRLGGMVADNGGFGGPPEICARMSEI